MTIPKNAGLSHLADVAEQARRDGLQILHSYPIRKKHEPRRLNPNRAGIEWLESDANHFDRDTEIEAVVTMEGTGQPANAEPELIVHRAYGSEHKSYPRPMFQIIPRDAFSGMGPSVQPCPGCYDFARTWACPDHGERHYDTDVKVWRIAHTDNLDCECSSCQPVGFSAPEAVTEVYRRIEEATAFAPLDPIEGHGTGEMRGILALAAYGTTSRRPEPFSITLTGTFTLEISGDTTQADEATVQIEVDRNEGTP